MVSLNTFPISIMNHLPLIIPVQPKGRGAFIQSNRQCVRACVRAHTAVSERMPTFCARYLPKAQNEGMDTAYVTGCRLFNEKVDER